MTEKIDNLLDAINLPEDLRKLDESQLKQVSDELREFLIKSVSPAKSNKALDHGSKPTAGLNAREGSCVTYACAALHRGQGPVPTRPGLWMWRGWQARRPVRQGM